jgi:hypothetical protein
MAFGKIENIILILHRESRPGVSCGTIELFRILQFPLHLLQKPWSSKARFLSKDPLTHPFCKFISRTQKILHLSKTYFPYTHYLPLEGESWSDLEGMKISNSLFLPSRRQPSLTKLSETCFTPWDKEIWVIHNRRIGRHKQELIGRLWPSCLWKGLKFLFTW